MPRVLVPTARQVEIRDAPELGLLVVAPAGCGKTEALALRVRGLLERQQASPPRKVLVLTFTNRARDNIRERLHTHVRPEHMRSRVTVANFHGLAARLIRAHGNVIGISADIGIPKSDWVTRVCREHLGLGWDAVDAVNAQLRTAKQESRTDAEILDYLTSTGNRHAVQVETRRQSEGRLTYDDMLRLAELILSNDQVAELYRNHFAAAIVDEFQDLTPQQLRVVQRIGAGRTTFAGDLAQGIYGFAGARPEHVHRQIRAEVTREIVFAESHRSSPAVLDLVNAMAPTVKGQHLTCANEDAWPGGGVAACTSFADVDEEAQWVCRFATNVLRRAPRHRIAVVTRTKGRRAALDHVFETASDVRSYRWDQPFVDKPTADRLRSALRRADEHAAAHATSAHDYLWNLAAGQDIQDPSSRETLSDAIVWAADLHADGGAFGQIANQIQAIEGETVLTAPGVHLLNGHLGKGQQFDWVVVAGLEQGTLPFFKAMQPDDVLEEARVLTVMISRARHGVVLTRVAQLNGWAKPPSQFLSAIQAVWTCRELSSLASWLNAVDWSALAAATMDHR